MRYLFLSSILSIFIVSYSYAQVMIPASLITTESGDTLFPFDSICFGIKINIQGIENGNQVTSWHYEIENATPSTAETKDVQNILLEGTGVHQISLDANHGILNHTFIVVKYCPPHAYFKLSADTICQNTCVQITDSSTHYPTDWYWVTPNAATQQNNSPQHISACYADTGLFPITLIASNPGGADTLTKYIYVTQAPIPTSVQLEYNIHYGDSVLLQVCAVGNSYSWQANNIYICQNCDSILQFKPDERNVLLAATVHTPPTCDVICNYNIITTGVPEDILIPTAFSPNGGGINDLFGLAELSAARKLEYFRIYNRWGECVFETNDQYEKWDGTYKNTIQPLGVYVWNISIINKLTGNRKQMSGNVTLLK